MKNHSQIFNIKSFIFIPRNIISKSMLSSNFEIFHWLPFLSKSLNFLVTNFCGLKQCNINYICGKNQDLKRILKFLRSKNITVPFLLWHPVVLMTIIKLIKSTASRHHQDLNDKTCIHQTPNIELKHFLSLLPKLKHIFSSLNWKIMINSALIFQQCIKTMQTKTT